MFPRELTYATEALFELALLAILACSAEVSYRVGLRKRSGSDDTIRSQIIRVEGAVLGLLSLLLGFTFGMAVSRYDARRQLVMKEANAIDTAYLRARLLPPPYQATVEGMLVSYIDARLQATESSGARSNGAPGRRVRSLKNELWDQVVAATKAVPQTVTTGLFSQSITEMFDTAEMRDHVLNDRVPDIALLLLIVVATIVAGLVGYTNGLAGKRALIAQGLLLMTITFVILTIIDLGTSHGGMIRVGEDSLRELRAGVAQSRTP